MVTGLPELPAKTRFPDSNGGMLEPQSQMSGDAETAGMGYSVSIHQDQIGKVRKLLESL